MKNVTHLEGVLYQHSLQLKVSGEKINIIFYQ